MHILYTLVVRIPIKVQYKLTILLDILSYIEFN